MLQEEVQPLSADGDAAEEENESPSDQVVKRRAHSIESI